MMFSNSFIKHPLSPSNSAEAFIFLHVTSLALLLFCCCWGEACGGSLASWFFVGDADAVVAVAAAAVAGTADADCWGGAKLDATMLFMQ